MMTKFVSMQDVRSVMEDAGKGSQAVHGGWAEFKELALLRGVPGDGNREKVALEMLEGLSVRESWLLSVFRELYALGVLEVLVTHPMTREEFDKSCDVILTGPAGDRVPAMETDPNEGRHMLMTYGHADRHGYAAAVTAWARARWEVDPEALDYDDEPRVIAPADVQHGYAVRIDDPDGWQFEWEDVTAETENAFPLTLLSLE